MSNYFKVAFRELEMLDEDELAAFKRGRNAKSHTHAKNTSINTYKLSTGFEAMFGYLDLLGKNRLSSSDLGAYQHLINVED